jgi:hypothetical protein
MIRHKASLRKRNQMTIDLTKEQVDYLMKFLQAEKEDLEENSGYPGATEALKLTKETIKSLTPLPPFSKYKGLYL